MSLSKLIIVTGPTASGKTALALKLAKQFHGEIVSADSRQIYRGMDIGTAKAVPDSKVKSQKSKLRNIFLVNGIRHHLIDIRNPNQVYTLAQFKKDAIKAIQQIHKRGRLPFLVGGTGFYISSLTNNLAIPEIKPHPKLRGKLEKLPVAQLYKMLKRKDLARAKTIDPHNKRRLIRALEIIAMLGLVPPLPSPPSGEGLREGGNRPFLILGIKKSNPTLRRSINERVDQMMRAGLVREVRKLTKTYGRRRLFTDTIGYREVMEYLEGKTTLPQARVLMKLRTWQFTRHQMTWFRKLPVIWIKNQTQAQREIKKFL